MGFPKIIIVWLLTVGSGTLAFGQQSRLVLHSNQDESISLSDDSSCNSGAMFDKFHDFSCACVTGLWAFFEENCEQAKVLIGGSNGQCVPLDFKIRKVLRLSPSDDNPGISSASVFDDRITSLGGKFTSVKETPRTAHFLPPGFPVVITSGKQSWRLSKQNKCMKPVFDPSHSNTNHLCIFNHRVEAEYQLDDVDCFATDEIIVPLKCIPYMHDKDFEGEEDPRTCGVLLGSHRVRRQVRQSVSGRAYLGALAAAGGSGSPAAAPASPPGGSQNASAAAPAPTGGSQAGTEDENSELQPIADQPILNAEMWNYMTIRAQERLGLRERHVTLNTDESYSPAFSFLELAKRIQQKSCPDHYVPDAHYDVAVGAFIAIQRNHMKFTDSFLDFATSERIEEALNACLLSITEPYPFLQRGGGTDESECNNETKPVTHGSYFKFDQILELKVAHGLASRSNEPIVETVWKVFVHAHSACFPFFKDNMNDHHRFTTIMLSMFTNNVNDIWFNITELQPDVYSGFLGNAVDLMDSVAYCSLFSRLESTYPWDLPRPKKFNSRRKRQIEQVLQKSPIDYQCLADMDARNFCRPPNYEYAFSGGQTGSSGYFYSQ